MGFTHQPHKNDTNLLSPTFPPMLNITAIELEGFQSIEQRTRIELKPITLLYGPNSAGKSAIFDALELLRTVLDPVAFDEQRAADMVRRWVRRPGHKGWREMKLAVEFIFSYDDPLEVWTEKSNWQGVHRNASFPCISLDEVENSEGRVSCFLSGKIVRIELTIKEIDRVHDFHNKCFLSNYRFLIDGQRVIELLYQDRNQLDSDTAGSDEYWNRWLIVDDALGFVSSSLFSVFEKIPDDESRKRVFTSGTDCRMVHTAVEIDSLSPMLLRPDPIFEFNTTLGVPGQICRNAADIVFYLGTMLWRPLRNRPPLVLSDRRAPKPDEALTVVDLELEGWWDTSTFSPSSPASLLKSAFRSVDEHFQGIAEATHAELLLRTAANVFWGGEHAEKNIESIKKRAEAVTRINHHLERSLFTEKLYQLGCASTLMVPIDLDEDDPKGYYSLAQPAVVRLFLKDANGQTVELQDVGSGVPFVLPVLYAISCQGFVKIQQPELHLHPALQASVADVFVEELHRPGCGQFLIETHSEHLLLRLLRRIRDTEKGKSLSDDVKLTHDQIAVYYFDPQVGGGTFVSRQLITPLGDFYNDWPRGFFAERDSDLFEK